MTEYPITDLLFEKDTDTKIRKIYRKFFDQGIKIKGMLIQIGLDYFTFGNSFISANLKFDRYLKCKSCNASIPINEVKYLWKNFQFHGECSKCGTHGIYDIDDQYLNNPSYLKFIRWSPENIDLEYDPLTGETTYYYNMPAAIKAKITRGNKNSLKNTPELFFQALKEKKKIELDSNNLYHFKRNTLAEMDQGWGKPVILSALADIWYMQTLRRGNEAIAAEHIVPFRTLFPAPTGALDPFSMHPDTLIHTDGGIKTLKELTLSDKLVTYDRKETSIKAIIPRNLDGIDSMFKVDVVGLAGIETKVNSVHPFRVWDSKVGSHVWKETKNITNADYFAYPVLQLPDIGLEQINKEDFIGKTWRVGTKSLPTNIKLNTSFLRFLGLFIAEGWTEKSGMVGLGFHKKEINFQNEVIKTLQTLLPQTKIRTENKDSKYGNWVSIRKQSVELQTLLDNLVGKGSFQKNINKLINKLSKKQVIALLSGLYDGDGCFFYDRGKYSVLALKSASRELIFNVRDLLISLGYVPSILNDYSYTKGERKNRIYQLKLSGFYAEQFAKDLGWKTKNYYEKNINKNHFFNDNFLYSKVKKIEPISDKEVISLEVSDETHSYLSLGIINKNSQMNLKTWRGKLEEDIRSWKQDPNHIGIFPIPIGSQNIGGDAKMLLVTAELKFLEETIINSLGVPLEFIKGGATWTGSSISLRIVENHFLTYRAQLEDFVNHFIIRKATELIKFPSVTVHFKRLRMADDSETKRLILELAATNKISLSKTLEEFGISFEEEKENIKMSKEFEISLAMDAAMKEAEAAGKAAEISAKYQVRAQQAMIDEQARIREAKFKDELTEETQGDPGEVDLSSAIDKYAEEVMLLDPAGQEAMLAKLESKMPYHAALVAKRIEEKLMLQGMLEPEIPEEAAAPPASGGSSKKPNKPTTKDAGQKKSQGHPKSGPK